MRLRLPLLVLSGLGSLALANGLDDKMRSGLDLTMMDRTFVIKTPEDIVKFASGSWMTKTVIPNDKTLIDTFAEVANRNLDVLHDILDHVSTAEPESLDASARKVGLFYRVAMDGAKANQLGVKPITQELEEIDKISDRSELMLVIGDLQRKGVTNTFTFSIDQDDLNERRVLPSFAQGGILIPDPDLYLGMASAIVRPVYVKTFAKLLAIAGHSETAKAEAEQSFAFEKDLAKLSSTPVEMRNVAANYHVLDWQTFEKSTPSIDWKSFTKAAGLPTLTEGIVRW
jgi:putative endopeptidase